MSRPSTNTFELSPKKRTLLKALLRDDGVTSSGSQGIPRRQAGDVIPLSFAQQRLWFLDQLEPNSGFYNVPSALRVRGPLHVEALRKTLDIIVSRHEVLRTTFVAVDGNPFQVIGASGSVELPLIDLSDRSDMEREREIQLIIREMTRRPFDLTRGPLFRTRLLQLGKEDHVLLMTLHHIVSDGWSMGVMYHEISVLYQAFSNSQPSPLPDLPIQYADYAVWQRNWLQGDVLETQLGYWKKQLENIQTLQLPTDRPRPAVQSYSGASQSIVVSRELNEALRTLSRQQGVTLFMTLLAAFQTLLHRYSGQEDIVVGSSIAGRNRSEIEGLIGFFVNTLALRSNLSGNPTFKQLLARVKEVALGAYAHQELPFEKLVEELHPERDLSHSPLFQVMFVLQNTSGTVLKLGGIAVSPMRVGGEQTKFDLTLSLSEGAEELRGSVEYSTALFDDATISRMLGHLQVLLEGIVADSNRPISALPILTEPERYQLLVEWNDTKREYPKDKCIYELFEEQVEQNPHAIAVTFEGQKLTYRELNTRANQLAHYLRGLGVGSEKLVGICVERSLEMVVGVLGILKARGAYVPLDPAYPKERLRFMVEDAEVSVVVTQEKFLESGQRSLLDGQPLQVCLDRDWPVIKRQSSENPKTDVASKYLAYVIYTSGSTGQPKGVQIEHRSVVNCLHSIGQRIGFTNRDCLLAVTTISFDIAGLELYLPLLAGGTVVLASREEATDGAELWRRLKECSATVMQGTPSTWRLLVEAGWGSSQDFKILCGGESLSKELAEALLERGEVWNLYGPSETTIWSTIHKVESRQGPVPIGRPIANTQIYILDPHLRPVPIGVHGELYIGGDGLARSYLNQPELTTEKFIIHSLDGEAAKRLYKTGDRARYLPDGNIEFLGRIDNQVKIRGFRVELGEIEAVLSQHPCVGQSVVVVREDAPGDKRLVAYVVSSQSPPPSTGEFRAYLQQTLPDYMIPSAYVFLDSLPLTPTGKIDRRSLPEPDRHRDGLEQAHVAPRDNVEYRLAKIWEDILGVRPIGVKDNFFESGGHSLLAVRLLARVEKEFNRSFPLSALFVGPTIDKLADLVRPGGEALKWNWLFPIQSTGSKPPLFLLHGSGELGRQLGMDQPVYGGRTHGLDGRRAHPSVEKMAAEYVKEIYIVQPEGPYFVGGFCFGGLLAFEVARQLRERDQEVALLLLLDPTIPRNGGAWSAVSSSLPQAAITRLAEQVRRHLRKLRPLRDQKRLTLVGQGVHWRFNSVKTRLARRVDSGIKMLACRAFLAFGQLVPETLRMFYFLEVCLRAARNYVPKAYSGRVTLLLAENDVENSLVEWKRLLAGKLEIYELPSEHHMDPIEGPHTQAWAERIRACLQNAQTNVSDDSSPGSNS